MRPDVLLIHPPFQRRWGSGVTFPLGLGYVAAAAREAGFAVALADCAPRFDTLSSASLAGLRSWLSTILRENEPRLAIGVGPCTTSAIRGLKSIAETCRDVLPSTPLIFGGPLASSPDQEWVFFEELGATAVVVGDGESPFVKWLVSLRDNQEGRAIAGVAYRTGSRTSAHLEPSLDSLPFPARDLGRMGEYTLSVRRDLGVEPFATMIGSRGCTHSCKFCVSGALRMGNYARRSFENIGAEVSHLVTGFSTRCLVFYDDALFPARETANDDLACLSDKLADAGNKLVWQFEVRSDVACGFTKDALRHAYTRGCRQINLGIEKSSDFALRELGKQTLVEHTREACKRIVEAVSNMRLAGTFVLGGPDETTQSLADTVAFARSLPLTFAHFNPLELYPATQLYREVFGADSRKWYDLVMERDANSPQVIFDTEALPEDRLLALVHDAYGQFYDDPNWRLRAEHVLGRQLDIVIPWTKRWRKDRLRFLK